MNGRAGSMSVLLPDPFLNGRRGTPGEGVAYRQDKSREVRHGWGWFCGGFLRLSDSTCEVRSALRPAAPRFWRFPAVLRTSRGLS